MKTVISSGIRFNKVLFNLVTNMSFILITVLANLLILAFSAAFYHLEMEINNAVHTFLDAAWWGYSTATAVGYGDIIPVTPAGKILGIFLMLTGTAIFAIYTALFAQSILDDEILRLNIFSRRQNKK